MKKNIKKNAALAALIIASLGGAANTGAASNNPVDIRNQVALVRQYTAEKADELQNTTTLDDLVPRPGQEDEMAWKKTWYKRIDFSDAFGDFWG